MFGRNAAEKKRKQACHGVCKIGGFHGGDYEEWRLLGYRIPVRTSQETHLSYRAQPVNAI
jgi:hypothetical protein